MIWRCPACRAQLAASDKSLECLGCAAMYEVIDGIPDLRYPPCADSFVRDDNSMARGIAAGAAGKSDEELVRAFFSVREGTDGWSRHDTEVRTRQSLVAPLRLRVEIDGWLNIVTGQGPFLDLGCGLGGFLTAAVQQRNRESESTTECRCSLSPDASSSVMVGVRYLRAQMPRRFHLRMQVSAGW